MIIALLNQKGGVGKTTLSVNLADAFASKSCRVLLIDADPQGSALAWSAVREKAPRFPVVGMPKASLHKDLPSVAVDYDVVIIDGPPRSNDIARSAILASDLVLIPVQPSPVDVWATDDTVKLVVEAQTYREAIRAAFVLNRKIANTAIGRDVVDVFAGQPFPVLDCPIGQPVAFAESFTKGLSVLETEPFSPAAGEIKALARLIHTSKRRTAA